MKLSSGEKLRLASKRAQRDALARRLADVTARREAIEHLADLDRDAVWEMSGRQGVLRAALSIVEHEIRAMLKESLS